MDWITALIDCYFPANKRDFTVVKVSMYGLDCCADWLSLSCQQAGFCSCESKQVWIGLLRWSIITFLPTSGILQLWKWANVDWIAALIDCYFPANKRDFTVMKVSKCGLDCCADWLLLSCQQAGFCSCESKQVWGSNNFKQHLCARWVARRVNATRLATRQPIGFKVPLLGSVPSCCIYFRDSASSSCEMVHTTLL